MRADERQDLVLGDGRGHRNQIDGQTAPPKGVFTQLSATFFGACGLRADRTAACWGEQEAPPKGSFTDLYASDTTIWQGYMCGLRPSGYVACSGGGTPALLGRYRQISGGSMTDCGIQLDGSVRCVGDADQVNLPAATP